MHTLIYSSQTVLADGISLAGQSAPESFLGYLEGLSGGTAVRDSIYLIYRFFLPMLWIFIPWAFAVITYCAWRSNASAGKDRPGSSVLPDPLSEKGRLLYALLASVITLFISYSYTLVRADTGVLLARTGPVLAAAAMFFAVSLFADDTLSEAGDEAGNPDDPESIPAAGSHSMTLSSCLLIALCLSVPFMIWARVNDMKNPYLWTYPDGDEKLVFSDTSRLYTYTAVPETFMLLSEVPIRGAASLGNGFMVSDQISYLEQYDRVDKKLKDAGFDDISYMGYDGQGFYYFMNTKACGTGYLPVARSMEAQEEILSRARKERPVIFRLDPKKSFYIYRWVLSKEAGYVYLAQDDCFYPAEVYAALMKNDPLMPKEGDDPGTADQVTDLGRVCESFGNSAASILDNICTDEKGGKATPALPVSSVSFEGRSGELLYINLDLEKIEASAGTSVGALEISFMPKSAASGSAPLIRADAAGGKLLIPAGMNTCWEEGAVTVTGFTFLDENNAPALTISPGELTDYLTDDPRCGYYEICSR
ncbi:MAG: hypothetical protein J5842_00195 [Lachnospiraceae bacterium]|nr:hypothetical protein [Lachnospiraceae bacterium]